jgi:hypothetical protein
MPLRFGAECLESGRQSGASQPRADVTEAGPTTRKRAFVDLSRTPRSRSARRGATGLPYEICGRRRPRTVDAALNE